MISKKSPSRRIRSWKLFLSDRGAASPIARGRRTNRWREDRSGTHRSREAGWAGASEESEGRRPPTIRFRPPPFFVSTPLSTRAALCLGSQSVVFFTGFCCFLPFHRRVFLPLYPYPVIFSDWFRIFSGPIIVVARILWKVNKVDWVIPRGNYLSHFQHKSFLSF